MLEQIEIIGISMIMLLQAYIFYLTYLRIGVLSNLLNPVNYFSVIKVKIPVNDIETTHPKHILSKLSNYIYQGENDEFKHQPVAEVSIVITNQESSDELKSILESLNTYLIRNRSAVADFNLVKDIVERTSDTVEEEINSFISVPLYLGLLGTLAGIILGLFNISDLSFTEETSPEKAADVLSNSIPNLLGGVKTAMFASFAGLALTIANSGWFYRKAKSLFEKRKNDFYSFIQVELMPVLNQSINSSLMSLQSNLHEFNEVFTHNIGILGSLMNKNNEDFTRNIDTLGGLMSKNHDAIIAQDSILTKLDSIDIADFVKANVKVLAELRKSTDSFAAFNQYVQHINDALLGTTQVVERMDSLLMRTEGMDKVSEKILATFEDNKTLMEFLQSHYSSLDESKQMLSDSVIGVGDILDKALHQLQQFTQEKIVKMQEVMIKEINLLEHDYPEKWKKLDNLEEIKKHTAQIIQNKAEKKTDLGGEIEELKDRLKSIDETLIRIRDRKHWYMKYL